MSEFVVMTSSAHVGAGRRKYNNQYRNVAVLEIENGTVPKMISERAKGVIRIVRQWPACHVGKTWRAEYQTALREADELLLSLAPRKA